MSDTHGARRQAYLLGKGRCVTYRRTKLFCGGLSGIIRIAGAGVLSGCALFASPDAKRGDQHLAAGHWEEASLAYKQALKDAPFDSALQGKYMLARERAGAMYEERG